MVRMIRKQIYFEPEQDALLKRRAREQHVSEAELIRRGIDHVAAAGTRAPRFTPALQAWAELKAFARERRRMEVPQTGRGWTRDELYDERLRRVSH